MTDPEYRKLLAELDAGKTLATVLMISLAAVSITILILEGLRW